MRPRIVLRRAAVVASLVTTVALVACGGGRGDSAPGRNVLHLYLESDPASLDPIQAVDVYRGRMVVYLYDGLVQFAEDEIRPNLAESWEVSDDGTVYTFHLREDVDFHNGRRLTAEDVKYSFERVLRSQNQSPLTWVFDFIDGAREMTDGEADELSGVRVLDSSAIEITLRQPFAPFLSLMAMPAAHIVPREEIERKGDQFSEAPVGTGPWVFESWAHDDVIRLTANSRYHGGRPRADGMEIRIIPETTTVIAEFERGNLDWADLNEFPKPEYDRFAEDPEWEPHVHTRPALVTYYLALNNAKPKFQDVRVRQALNYAVDVATIARAIYPGETVLSYGPIPPGLPGYREDGEPYRYDPARARALLADAGVEGLTFDVFFRTLSLNQRFLEAVQANLAAAGVTMNLQQRDWTAVRQSMQQGELDAYLANWYADYPDAENFLYPLFFSEMAGAGGNAAFYSSATVDSLILTARRTLDDAERIRMYSRADSLIQAHAPWIFTVHPVDADIVQPWVEGYEIPQVFYGQKWTDISLDGDSTAEAEAEAEAEIEPEEQRPVETARDAYSFEDDSLYRALDIPFTYTNLSADTTWMGRCGEMPPGFVLEKRVGGAWTLAYAPICPMILVPPVAVPPGETFSGTASIRAGMVENTQPRLQVEEAAGSYRLVLEIHDGWDPESMERGALLPEAGRTSGTFEIEE